MKNKNEPLVSVIIPVYNCEKYVEKAVRSIMEQTYTNLEILILDDCSTDNSFKILLDLSKQDKRIKLFRNDVNSKIVFSLNKLISLARGEFIARMDADDISLPKRIEKQISFLLNNPDYSICGTSVYRINEFDKKIGKIKFPSNWKNNKYFVKYSPTLCHPTVCGRTNIFRDNKYDELFNYAEDYELWVRLMYKKNIKIGNLNEKLFKYRIFIKQVSSIHHEEQIRKSIDILQKYSLIHTEDINIHARLFFGLNSNSRIEYKEKKYIQKLYNELFFKEINSSTQVAARIITFFIHNKSSIKDFAIFFFYPINLLACFIGIIHKITKRV